MSDLKEKYRDVVNNHFCQKRILVIGDLMVDEYIRGKVSRISPEAPVPVLDYRESEMIAGGASNVAHNLVSFGAKVYVMGTANTDKSGMWLRSHFDELGIDYSGIISEENRPTTVKVRYTTKGQQLLRVDLEDTHDIATKTKNRIIDYLEEEINDLDAVILSDYKKGVLLDGEFVRKIISICNTNNVLVSVDSKSRNIAAFENADFVKPNNLELEDAVSIRIEDENTLNLAGNKYLERSNAKALVVTRGSRGISVFEKGKERCDYPAKDVRVYDVSGAGDTVISTITLGMASKLIIGEAVRLANLAAGVVITKDGTAVSTVEELLKSINES